MNSIGRYAIAALLAVAFCLASTVMATENAPVEPSKSLMKEIKKGIGRMPLPAPAPGESSYSRKALRAHRNQLRKFNALRANWGEKALDDSALSELTGTIGQPLIIVSESPRGILGGRYIRLASTYLLANVGNGHDENGAYAAIVPLVFIDSAYTRGDPVLFRPIDLIGQYGNEFSGELDGLTYAVYAMDGTPPFHFDFDSNDFNDLYAYGSHLRYWTLEKWPYDSGSLDLNLKEQEERPFHNVKVVIKDGTFYFYTEITANVDHISSYDDDGCGDGVGSYWTWAGMYLNVPVYGLAIGGRSDRDSWLWIDMPPSTITLRVRDIYVDNKITTTGPHSLGSLDVSLTLGAKVYLTTHR